MKFKSGDMCIITGGVWIWSELIGKIVTLTTVCTVHENSWDSEPPLYVGSFKKPVSLHEGTLRLIKDGDLTVNEDVATPETLLV